MTTITTEGSARAWGGVCYGLVVHVGALNALDVLCGTLAKAPSRGEGRALFGGAVRGVL